MDTLILFGVPLLCAAAGGGLQWLVVYKLKANRPLWLPLPLLLAALCGSCLYLSDRATGIFFPGLEEFILAILFGCGYVGSLLGTAVGWWCRRKKP